MLPSLLARESQNGLKHFLRMGFELSDPLFAGVMQRFTEEDEAQWMKGPCIQVGLPLRPGNQGWEDLNKDEKWLVPGSPRQVTRTFKAPFASASREDDYRVAWAFFESTGQSESVR